MFTEPTVFILGAGASWHYGYPTGEMLVEQAIDTARRAEAFFRWSANIPGRGSVNQYPTRYISRKSESYRGAIDAQGTLALRAQWSAAADECKALANRLETVAPPVIDAFLNHNPSLREIGKLIIAWIILQCETDHEATGFNANRENPLQKRKMEFNYQDNFYRSFVHALLSVIYCSENILNNRVNFITFNYDVSLEIFIREALEHTDIVNSSDIDQFFSAERFMHVYGAIRDPTATAGSRSLPRPFKLFDKYWGNASFEILDDAELDGCRALLDEIYEASQRIRTIGSIDKTEDESTLKYAKTALGTAERIHILGYGFDETNSDILCLSEHLREGKSHKLSGPKKIFVNFTNFGDHNTINKKAGDIFHQNRKMFIGNKPQETPSDVVTNTGVKRFYEKSIKDVCRALRKDFDW